MNQMGEPTQVEFTTSTEALQAVPYIREHEMGPGAERWMTVGTGVAHELVEKFHEAIDLEKLVEDQWQQWDQLFTPDDPVKPRLPGYVEYVRGTVFTRYQCPGCVDQI